MSMRKVVIDGITVDMYRHEEGGTIRPLKVHLDYAKAHPEVFGSSEADVLEAIARLEAAGVVTVPVEEADARAAGVKWDEATQAVA